MAEKRKITARRRDGFSFIVHFRIYILANIGPLRVTMDDNITTPGYLKMYVRQRYAGKVLDSAAIKLIKIATS